MKFVLTFFVCFITTRVYAYSTCNKLEFAPARKKLNFDPGNWATVFLDKKAECDQLVKSVSFYANRPGIYYLSYWRDAPGTTNSVQLVRRISVPVSRVGYDMYYLRYEGRMIVRKGYYLGIHLPDNSLFGIVSYEQSNLTPTKDVSRSFLQRFISVNLQDSELPDGKTLKISPSSVKRAPAVIIGSFPIQILGGDTYPRSEFETGSYQIYIPNIDRSVISSGFISRFEFIAESRRDRAIQLVVLRHVGQHHYKIRWSTKVSWYRGKTRVIRYTPKPVPIKVEAGDRIGFGIYRKSPLQFSYDRTKCEGGRTYYAGNTVDESNPDRVYRFSPVSPSKSCRVYSFQASIQTMSYQEKAVDTVNEGYSLTDSFKYSRSLSRNSQLLAMQTERKSNDGGTNQESDKNEENEQVESANEGLRDVLIDRFTGEEKNSNAPKSTDSNYLDRRDESEKGSKIEDNLTERIYQIMRKTNF